MEFKQNDAIQVNFEGSWYDALVVSVECNDSYIVQIGCNESFRIGKGKGIYYNIGF